MAGLGIMFVVVSRMGGIAGLGLMPRDASEDCLSRLATYNQNN